MRTSRLALAVALAAPVAVLPTAAQARHADAAAFNTPGNVLIADQFNNRVIEINRAGQIVWSFGDGAVKPGPDAVVAPNDAERIGTLTLIAGTGAPPAPSATEPECAASGCADNRVLLVNSAGHIVWQYGQAGVTGGGADELNTPVFAAGLPGRRVLIADQGNARVIEVNHDRRIVWQYGMTGVPGDRPNELNNPNSAELLGNGDVLIADESNNRVIEVNHDKRIVWQYGSPPDTTTLNAPAFASRLADGDTLIADSANNRVVEVNPAKHVVWTYVTNGRAGSVAAPTPTRAVRLADGDTLISDQFNHQVIEVTHSGAIVLRYGTIGVPGRGPGQLNAPYDAKVIGDYTGLTFPGTW